MYLLPDKSKQSKRKTDVKMKTLNPVFNEIMKVSNNVSFVITTPFKAKKINVTLKILLTEQIVQMCLFLAREIWNGGMTYTNRIKWLKELFVCFVLNFSQ